VPADDEPEFDRWLLDSHLPRIASQPGVLRARAFAAVREDIPIDYYLSPGNRMLQIELDGGAGLEPLLADAFTDALGASLAWDLRLPYVRRDVYRPLGHVRAARRLEEGG
jgi:hypothetical protein